MAVYRLAEPPKDEGESQSQRALVTGINCGMLGFATGKPALGIAGFVFGTVAGERDPGFARFADIAARIILK